MRPSAAAKPTPEPTEGLGRPRCLPRITEALKATGQLPVIAYTSDAKTELEKGTLALVDNQVDATTRTIRLKGEFPEKAFKLPTRTCLQVNYAC
jgi:hypothetical protein